MKNRPKVLCRNPFTHCRTFKGSEVSAAYHIHRNCGVSTTSGIQFCTERINESTEGRGLDENVMYTGSQTQDLAPMS